MESSTPTTEANLSGRRFAAIALLFAAASLAMWRFFFPERSLDTSGPRALMDAGFALGALALFSLLCAALGRWALERFRPAYLTAAEIQLFSLPLGWGAFSLWAFTLGMVGALTPLAVALTLLALLLLTLPACSTLLLESASALRALPARFRAAPVTARLGGTLAAALLAVGALHALAPAWSYDALMYHLVAPQRFLQAGRLLLLPEIWQANGPSLTEMLFLPGLAAGSDSFARLIHLVSGGWLAWAVLLFGRRFTPRPGGRWAAWIFLGAPGLPIVAGFAYVDLVWVLYVFLALYALSLSFSRARKMDTFILAGLLMGFGMSSKYLALGSFLAVLTALALPLDAHAWRARMRGAAYFAGAVLLIAAPWYLKNLLWTGDPFYPLWLGGPAWPPERTALLMGYLRSIGRPGQGAGLLATLWSVFFSSAGRTLGVEGLSPFFLLALFYLWSRKSPAMRLLALTSLFYGGFWALTSMQVRFLLPVFPALSLLAAWSMDAMTKRWNLAPPLPTLAEGLTLVSMLLNVLLTLGVLLTLRAPAVVVGAESKRVFLRRAVFDFRAVEFIQERLPQDAGVLLLWDGMTRYCGSRCLPDADQARWPLLTHADPDPHDLARELGEQGITHLLVSEGDAAHMIAHDPSGLHQRAYRYLLERFEPACTTPVYADERMRLLELTCP